MIIWAESIRSVLFFAIGSQVPTLAWTPYVAEDNRQYNASAVLEIKPRAWFILGKCYTNWATSLDLKALPLQSHSHLCSAKPEAMMNLQFGLLHSFLPNILSRPLLPGLDVFLLTAVLIAGWHLLHGQAPDTHTTWSFLLWAQLYRTVFHVSRDSDYTQSYQ